MNGPVSTGAAAPPRVCGGTGESASMNPPVSWTMASPSEANEGSSGIGQASGPPGIGGGRPGAGLTPDEARIGAAACGLPANRPFSAGVSETARQYAQKAIPASKAQPLSANQDDVFFMAALEAPPRVLRRGRPAYPCAKHKRLARAGFRARGRPAGLHRPGLAQHQERLPRKGYLMTSMRVATQ